VAQSATGHDVCAFWAAKFDSGAECSDGIVTLEGLEARGLLALHVQWTNRKWFRSSVGAPVWVNSGCEGGVSESASIRVRECTINVRPPYQAEIEHAGRDELARISPQCEDPIGERPAAACLRHHDSRRCRGCVENREIYS
jgi:hypothetical protein